MLSEAITKIESLAVQAAKPSVFADPLDPQRTWYWDNNRKCPIPLKSPDVEALTVNSLTAVADFIKHYDDTAEPDSTIIVHVVDPTRVSILSTIQYPWRNRDKYLHAFYKTPFEPGLYLSYEDFMIELQTHFRPNPDRDTLISLFGQIKDENIVEYTDDGMSQKVIASTGLTTRGPKKLPNPVTLIPMRTFPEIDQPSSPFIVRVRKNDKAAPQVALFLADNNAWEIDAKGDIKTFLKGQIGYLQNVKPVYL